MLQERFVDLKEMCVLDLGGTVAHWTEAPVRPRSVYVLNLVGQESDVDWIKVVQGDACDPPAPLLKERFDLIYSNSVIEHVGGHARRRDFAAVVHACGPHHWIQTPYRYFPVEPHWLFPGLQYLPPVARAAVISRWPLGAVQPTGRQAVHDVLGVELLTKTEMRYYFPDSELVNEPFLFATKSLIAVS